jgi:hypothetical protein
MLTMLVNVLLTTACFQWKALFEPANPADLAVFTNRGKSQIAAFPMSETQPAFAVKPRAGTQRFRDCRPPGRDAPHSGDAHAVSGGPVNDIWLTHAAGHAARPAARPPARPCSCSAESPPRGPRAHSEGGLGVPHVSMRCIRPAATRQVTLIHAAWWRGRATPLPRATTRRPRPWAVPAPALWSLPGGPLLPGLPVPLQYC